MKRTQLLLSFMLLCMVAIAQYDENLIYPADYISAINPENRSWSAGLPVGTIQGSADVSPTGASTYTFPIFIAPGTAGMQPSLSVAYSSQSGNGQMGIGWGLAGQSAITRVPQTMYMDGINGGVNLNWDDRYALDGNRLLQTTTGTYGSNNMVYAGEVESPLRVTSHGTSGYGTQYFTVQASNGTVMHYGTTADSRVEAPGMNTVLMWRLSKVQDIHGNYMKYIYGESNGESRLIRIEYTGKEGGANPYNSVKFFYSERNDESFGYICDRKIENTVLLTGIQVLAEGQQARRYEFKYSYNKHSRLTEIIEYGTDDIPLNSTVVDWGSRNPRPEFEKADASFPIHGGQDKKIFPGDFNGDGRTDMLYLYESGGSTFFNVITAIDEGATSFESIWNGNAPTGFDFSPTGFEVHTAIVCDINNDGRSDVLFQYFENDEYHFELRLYGGASLQDGFALDENDAQVFVGNFLGLGEQEILVRSNSRYVLYSWNDDDHTLNAVFDGSFSLSDIQPASIQYATIADMEGDGRHELILDGEKFRVSTSGIVSLGDSYAPSYTSSVERFNGDFNGDGNSDIMLDGGQIYYGMGTRYEASPSTDLPLEIFDGYEHMPCLGDFNGDGYTDVAQVNNNYELVIYYLNGDGTYYIEETPDDDDEYYSTFFGFYAVDFNGDGQHDLWNLNSQANFSTHFLHKNSHENYVSAISDGFKKLVQFTYTRYGKGMAGYYTYPSVTELVELRGGFPIVTSMTHETPAGNDALTLFTFEDGIIHRQGKGFLGFLSVIAENAVLNSRTEQSFELVTGNGGKITYISLSQSRTSTAAGTPLSTSNFTNAFKLQIWNGYFPYMALETTLNHATGNTSTTSYAYNTNGTLLSETSTWADGRSARTSYTYTNATSAWGAYQPNEVSMLPNNDASKKKVTKYQYSSGVLNEVIDFFNREKKRHIAYTYNTFGLPSTKQEWGTGIDAKTTTYGYDSHRRYVEEITTDFDYTQTMLHDPRTGAVISKTGLNGFPTTIGYDGFGRLASVSAEEKLPVSVAYSWAVGTYPKSKFKKVSSTSETSHSEYYNCFGQVVHTINEGFTTMHTWAEYDDQGRLMQKTGMQSGSPEYKVYAYDDYGRITSTSFLGQTTGYAYEGNTITITAPDGVQTTKTYHASGLKKETADPGGKVRFTAYNSLGQPTTIEAAGGITSMLYNEYGQQTHINDPNAGTTRFEYDALGRLTKQIDQSGDVTGITYDLLGRQASISTTEEEIRYSYKDADELGAGQVGRINSTSGSWLSFSYDIFGRLISEQETGEGGGSSFYTYDENSRVKEYSYPSGFKIRYHYSNGTLYKITRVVDEQTETLIWELKSLNNFGQVAQIELGCGLLTDYSYTDLRLTQKTTGTVQNMEYGYNPANGNMTYRKDNLHSLREDFHYDNLYRLDCIKMAGRAAIGMQYASNGNMLSKSDAGAYTYHKTKKHAINSITPYAGNMNAFRQQVTYNSYGKATVIEEGNKRLEITYGIHRQRTKTVLYIDDRPVQIKTFTKNYETLLNPNGEYKFHYINSPTGVAAVYTEFKPLGGATTAQMNYILTDHLGSITYILNEDGTVKEEFSYGAWGNSRDPETWESCETPQDFGINSRGFTGHEHIGAFGLINMNGRMYDPALGRMLSPDNYVQSPDFTQNYNRYSYVLNSPLRYVDPSGEIIGFIIAGVVIGAYIGGLRAEGKYNPAKWKWNKDTWRGVVIGGVIGGLSGAVVGALWASGATFSIAVNTFGSNSVPLVTFSQANTAFGIFGGSGAVAMAGASIDWSSVNRERSRQQEMDNKGLESSNFNNPQIQFSPEREKLSKIDLERDFAESFQETVMEPFVNDASYVPRNGDSLAEDLLYSGHLKSDKHYFGLRPIEMVVEVYKGEVGISRTPYKTQPYYNNKLPTVIDPGYYEPIYLIRGDITYKFAIKYQIDIPQ